MNDVAEFLDVSIYTANRMIKNITEENFQKYIHNILLECARKLLCTTELS